MRFELDPEIRRVFALMPSAGTEFAIRDWIVDRRGHRRPTDLHAKVLALCVALSDRDQPFPKSEVVAEAFRTTPDAIDAVVNVALYHQEIYRQNHVVSRNPWAVHRPHYQPCPELIAVAKRRPTAW